MATKRKIGQLLSQAPTSLIAPGAVKLQEDEMDVQMLGAGQEVGRSCCVVRFKGRTIVLDTGIHPAFQGMASLPFLDEVDWATVDAILITHFHLDHVGCLPYIMEKTNFREGHGKVYMTQPTKAVYRYLMSDFVRVSTAGTDDNLFTEDEMTKSFDSIVAFDFEQEIVLPALAGSSTTASVRFTSFPAGHVLGACMYLLEIAGTRVLYTGDYSTEEDRHLIPAKVPMWEQKPDVMICESTYGYQSHEPRLEKEARFTSLVRSIVKRGGKVLLPVFALGRAQELLLLLDEYWAQHPDLHAIPVYFISSLAVKCMEVYRTFIHTMSPNVREKFARGINPFDFKSRNSFIRPYEKNIKSLLDGNGGKPCVVMASPGFLTNGVSRELLEQWAPDPRNGLIITGYSVEGVMARTIMSEPSEITGYITGQRIQRRMSVDYISFSAHVDYTQNAKFIDDVMPPHLILVHGEANTMGRLRAALKSKFAERKDDIQIYAPRNVEVVKLKFRGERMAKALGVMASTGAPTAGSKLNGLLVSKDFTYTLLDPKDLGEFTGLSTSVLTQRHRMNLPVGWDLIRWHLEGMYGKIVEGLSAPEKWRTLRVMGTVDIKRPRVTVEGEEDKEGHEIVVEWVSSVTNDMIADSAIALLLGIDRNPSSVKKSSQPCGHRHRHAEPPTPPHTPGHDTPVVLAERLDALIAFLGSYFSKVELLEPLEWLKRVLQEDAEREETRKKAEEEEKVKAEEEEKMIEKDEGIKKEGSEDIEMAPVVEEKVERVEPKLPMLRVFLDQNFADVSVENLAVTSDLDVLKVRVENVVELALSVITPLDGRKTKADEHVPVPAEEGQKEEGEPVKKVKEEEIV